MSIKSGPKMQVVISIFVGGCVIGLLICCITYFPPIIERKESPLPLGTQVEIIDGHEYLTTRSHPILGSSHIASRVHKADCKFCRTSHD